ncbi:MAG: type VII secretion target [Caldilineaceae bacterium]
MNSQQGVYMEVPAVRGMAKNFQTISDVLKAVSKALEAIANALKATAFIGLVGGYAVIHFIEVIKPQIDEMVEKTAELSKDLSAAADAYERGDALGATKFH